MSDIGIKATSKGVVALLIVAIVVLLGIVGGAVLFWNNISEVTTIMEAKKKQVDEAQKMASSLEESKMEYEDTQAQLQNLEQTISTEEYIPTLLSQLESLCKNVDMRVLSVRPENVEEKAVKDSKKSKDAKKADTAAKDDSKKDVKKESEPSQQFYKEKKIGIEVGGFYLNTLDLLYKITSFSKIIAVNSVQMSPVTTTNMSAGSPPLKIQMSVTAFILNPPSDKASEPFATPEDIASTSKGADNEAR